MKKTKFNINTNPLLTIKQFPDYKAINPDHALPAINYLIKTNKELLEKILANNDNTNNSDITNWQTYEKIEAMSDKLSKAWSPISHLHSVNNNDAWRGAYQECQQIMSLYDAELSQHTGLYKFFCELQKSEQYANYNATQKKIIADTIQDFELSGVSLPDADKQTYQQLMQSASELSMTFSNNVLDATQAFQIWIDDVAELNGVPESALALYEQLAEQFKAQFDEDLNDETDDAEIEPTRPTAKYCVSLDFPSYFPIMSYCTNRDLRKKLYTAYVTRASDQGPNASEFDNTSAISAILTIRQDLAKLLGYKDYASLSLVNKMAKTPAKVLEFLNELVDKAKPIAEREYAELKEFSKTELKLAELEAWDITYAAEQLKQQKYSISEELLREYFPLNKVMSGLFNLTQQLFDVELKEVHQLSTWDKSVKTYAVMEKGKEIAYFYLDLYSRPGKSGGAWMNNAVDRIINAEITQLPIAYLVCNFMPPATGKEAYLNHQEINTLFHEFGHGLNHMLSKIEYAAASGINGVEWDAVELPSQFMENFCYQKQVIIDMSEHKDSKQQLPDSLFDSLIASKNFQSALMMLRQLEFSLFDIQIHDQDIMNGATDIMEVLAKLRAKIAVTPSPDFARFPMSFSHIFAGGYAAGYYSYKWAEVLSADAFAKFEELGIFNSEVGAQFKNEILSRGSSRTANENFVAFRDREPTIEALLRHNGINK